MENINSNYEKLIIKLSKNLPYCFISGSVSLYLTGFLNRKINDLDICIPIQYQKMAIKHFNRLKYGFLLSLIFNLFKPKKHYKYKINNISLCVFYTKEQSCLIIPFKNTKIKIGFPEFILEQKTKFVEQNLKIDRSKINQLDFDYESENIKKHTKDLKYYYKNKKSIDRLYKTKIVLNVYEVYNF